MKRLEYVVLWKTPNLDMFAAYLYEETKKWQFTSCRQEAHIFKSLKQAKKVLELEKFDDQDTSISIKCITSLSENFINNIK